MLTDGVHLPSAHSLSTSVHKRQACPLRRTVRQCAALQAAFPFGLAVSSSSLPKPSLKPVGDSDLALSGGDAVAVSLGSALDELDRFMRKH